MRKGWPSFLAYVLVVQEEELRPEDVPIVRDYSDVFPKEISGLPLDREMGFTIELLPGIAPISQALYRMAPRELSELIE